MFFLIIIFIPNKTIRSFVNKEKILIKLCTMPTKQIIVDDKEHANHHMISSGDLRTQDIQTFFN
jgi:hypothetical protein